MRKVAAAVDSPSLTVNVTEAVPTWSAAGVTCTDRLNPLPTIWMPLRGTRAGLEELAVTVRLMAGVS